MSDWLIDVDILNGYPYPFELDYEIPIEFLTTPFYYRDSSRFMWSISSEINNGYPYVFNLEFNPPYHFPIVQKIELNIVQGYVGASSDLIVTLSEWKYIDNNDILQISFKNSSDEVIYVDNVMLYDSQSNPLSITIPSSFLEIISVGLYKIQAKVFREIDNVSSETLSTNYSVTDFPLISITAIIPNKLSKPITDKNNTFALYYKVIDMGIERIRQITNTFKLANFSTTSTLRSPHILNVTADTRTSSIYNFSFAFNVTDSNFKLISFKFYFEQYGSNNPTQVRYQLDGATLVQTNFPMNDWVEYIFPEPKQLDIGSHTITAYNSPSYWYVYSTTIKPIVEGMTITSSTLYRMEMVYSILPFVNEENVVNISIDDTISSGMHPIIIDTSAIIKDYGELNFSKKTNNMLNIEAISLKGLVYTNIPIFKGNRPKRYGVSYDVNDSNPVLTRLYNSVGLEANVATTLSEEVLNDFDNIYPFNRIKKEIILGREMIKIPKFYIRRELIDNVMEIVICEKKYDNSYVPHEMFLKGNIQWTGNHSEDDYNDYVYIAKYELSNENQSVADEVVSVNQARSTMRENARAIDLGWSILDIATWDGLQKLFLIVFATRNSRDVMIGSSSSLENTGLTLWARSTCVQIVNRAMSFYGIENLYGNAFKRLDGINFNNNSIYICTDISQYADDMIGNYRELNYTKSVNDGYITKIGFDEDNKFVQIATETEGSATTYFTSYYTASTEWCDLRVGGYHSRDELDKNGIFHMESTGTSSTLDVNTTSRLVYRPI